MNITRGYITKDEAESLTGLTFADQTAADKAIAPAEAIVDTYLGVWCKAVLEIKDTARAGSATTLQISANHAANINGVNRLKGCILEIMGGAGEGQTAVITKQDLDGTVHFATLTTAPDATSYYRIYQLGKYPRDIDLHKNTDVTPHQYYKPIPRQLKEAVAAQIQYMNAKGAAFFESDDSTFKTERIDNYSYTKSDDSAGGAALIAPRVRSILSGTGLINRTGGHITVPNTIL